MAWNDLDPATRTELNQRLTPRQHDVLILLLAGCSYDSIATMLDISIRTVRTHRKRAIQIYDQITRKDAA